MEQLVQLADKGAMVSWDLANIHVGLGHDRQAIEWLERAYDEAAS